MWPVHKLQKRAWGDMRLHEYRVGMHSKALNMVGSILSKHARLGSFQEHTGQILE
jgi:hypothetical protein